MGHAFPSCRTQCDSYIHIYSLNWNVVVIMTKITHYVPDPVWVNTVAKKLPHQW